jgi:hypothetical protein
LQNLETTPSAGWSLQRSARLGEFLILVVAGLAALIFQVSLPGRLVTDGDYRPVAAMLEREREEGDVVLLYPWWTERARNWVPSGLPVVGYLGSDQDPLSRFRRVWLLAQPRLPRADFDGFERKFRRGHALLSAPSHFGNLSLSLYQNGFYQPRPFSAVSAHAAAKVYLESPTGNRTPCPFDGTAHRCPAPDRVYVAPEWHELFYRPERCLWMPPPGGRRRLVAEFSQVPTGSALTLAGGIVGEEAFHRDPGLTPVQINVEEIGSGRTLLQLSISPGVEGMQTAQIQGTPDLPERLDLKVSVQSDNPARRLTCIDLFSEQRGSSKR